MSIATPPTPSNELAQLNERSREIFRQIVESYLATGELPLRTGNEHPIAAPYGLYAAADGYPYFVQAYGKVTWDLAASSPITADDVAMAAPVDTATRTMCWRSSARNSARCAARVKGGLAANGCCSPRWRSACSA